MARENDRGATTEADAALDTNAADRSVASESGVTVGAGRPGRVGMARPLFLTAVLVLLDQLSKAWIVRNIPLYYRSGYAIEVVGDFFRIIHVRNPAISFSIGHGLPETLRRWLFIVLPVVVVAILLYLFFRTDEFRGTQRWFVAAILAGGIGNLIDRVFRPAGVVDFLDVKFYGLFGFERWPTFNVADSSTVVGGILLVIAMLMEREKR